MLAGPARERRGVSPLVRPDVERVCNCRFRWLVPAFESKRTGMLPASSRHAAGQIVSMTMLAARIAQSAHLPLIKSSDALLCRVAHRS